MNLGNRLYNVYLNVQNSVLNAHESIVVIYNMKVVVVLNVCDLEHLLH